MDSTLTEAQQSTLLELARAQIEEFVRTKGRVNVPPDDPRLDDTLRADRAVFVTIKNRGRLRGCIGTIVAHEPLYQSVLHNAAQACQDPRFHMHAITPEELDAIDIEISVLGPLRRVQSPNEVVVGRDGLLLTLGPCRGVFLPQVPGEQGWDREAYLQNIGRKAGAGVDAYKDPNAVLETFTAQVFGEHERRGT
jgi:AmmeMemoRadiSam system protein A